MISDDEQHALAVAEAFAAADFGDRWLHVAWEIRSAVIERHLPTARQALAAMAAIDAEANA